MIVAPARVFWVACGASVVAFLLEHVLWFAARSQPFGDAVGYLWVPLIMGLASGVLAGGLAAAASALLRRKPRVIRYAAVAIVAALGAVLGTVFFAGLFLVKWFTVPVIVVVMVLGMLSFARDPRPAS